MQNSSSIELRICYFSGWANPKIHYGFKLSSNNYSNWQTLSLQKYQKYKDIWYIDVPLLSSNFNLEFVFCNEDMTEWDHPAITKHSYSENYSIQFPGKYIIYIGKLFKIDENDQQQTTKNKILVITDLDGTLFGDCEQGKKALRNFNEFWLKKLAFGIAEEKKPVLVYSTGRDWGLFEELQKKAYLLWPDVYLFFQVMLYIPSKKSTLSVVLVPISTNTMNKHPPTKRIQPGKIIFFPAGISNQSQVTLISSQDLTVIIMIQEKKSLIFITDAKLVILLKSNQKLNKFKRTWKIRILELMLLLVARGSLDMLILLRFMLIKEKLWNIQQIRQDFK